MAETVLAINLIVSNPVVRGGRPIIGGTTLRVQDVVTAYLYRHQTPEEVADNYQMSPAQVHAALAYYYEHRNEFDAQIQADDEYIQEAKEKGLGQRHPSIFG
jgi:uncharacterized protein (DUF433 family)